MPETLVDLHFPSAGLDRSLAFGRQPARAITTDQYARTTRDAVNVRAYDPVSQRARGGSRPGLRKYIPARLGAEDFIVQELSLLVTTQGDTVQLSQSGRVVRVIAVSQGKVKFAVADDADWTGTTNNTGEEPELNITGYMNSTVLQQKTFFTDGINYVYYNPLSNTVEPWVATSGALPVDDEGGTARLICTWRGRVVLSGLVNDPHNWFMCRVDNPFDWAYRPSPPTATDPIAGNNAPLGLVGDVVTALIPYSDDTLIFGCDHEIWMLRGDPLAGGQLDLVSDAIGIAWGSAWCKDPYGNVYFFSNRCGIYTMAPGSQPVRISSPIEKLLNDIDTGLYVIRMLWNDRQQGLHVFITLTDEPAETTHFFWEKRTGGWTKDVFANTDHNPICCVTYDGNLPTDRIQLLGSWDGFVRALDHTADDDDGTPIDSYVFLGPLLTPGLDDMILRSLQAVLGQASGEVTCAVYCGATAEEALDNEPEEEFVWNAGRNLTDVCRRSGHAIYLKISSSSRWAMESIRAFVETRGRVRQRGR